jgi:hypothetical protein
MGGQYDVAQVCENDHTTNASHHDLPAHDQEFCGKCGEITITACPKCKTEIRGWYTDPGVINFSATYSPPSFCYKCGSAFPWTQRAITAAQKYADDIDTLTIAERDELKKSIPDLVTDSPSTPGAQSKFQKLTKKAGKDVYESMRSILTSVVTEAVKRTVFGPPV